MILAKALLRLEGLAAPSPATEKDASYSGSVSRVTTVPSYALNDRRVGSVTQHSGTLKSTASLSVPPGDPAPWPTRGKASTPPRAPSESTSWRKSRALRVLTGCCTSPFRQSIEREAPPAARAKGR